MHSTHRQTTEGSLATDSPGCPRSSDASKTKLIQPGRKQAQYIFFACAQHSPVGLTRMAGCAGRRTNKRILCTCRVVPGCIAGHRLGLVGPSGVGSRSIVALGSTILRALLVLRGVLGPYSSQRPCQSSLGRQHIARHMRCLCVYSIHDHWHGELPCAV